MSVLIVTSHGDIVVDLYTDKCPLTCKNFLKLCKIKYYNNCIFHNVQKDFIAQTGDPTGTGTGGDSIYKFLYNREDLRFFRNEIHPELDHSKKGTIAMASATVGGGGNNPMSASQFYFTLRDNLDYLDGKHTVFGRLAEGFDTLSKINEAYVNAEGRTYVEIEIQKTHILEDPPRLAKMMMIAASASPEEEAKDDTIRLEAGWVPMDEKLGPQELEEVIREKAAHSSAVILECIGDIPDAEVKPPENVLFVCNLNPATEGEDLHTIFSQCGPVISAKVIQDYKTGESLCYAFIEFESKDGCKKAYEEMNGKVIDDRSIHVDFSQSVSNHWSRFQRKDSQNGKGLADRVAKDHVGRKLFHEKREHSRRHYSEKIHRRSPHGYAEGKKRRRYELDTEDKAGLCDGTRQELRREMERRYDDGLMSREKKTYKEKRKR